MHNTLVGFHTSYRDLVGQSGIGERGRNMATVIRLDPGGGALVEQSWLTIEQAKSLAKRLAAEGEPARCWCVGLWDTEEEDVAV
jgi:hypothetical protein